MDNKIPPVPQPSSDINKKQRHRYVEISRVTIVINIEPLHAPIELPKDTPVKLPQSRVNQMVDKYVQFQVVRTGCHDNGLSPVCYLEHHFQG